VLLNDILNNNYCTILLVTYVAALLPKEVFIIILCHKPDLAVTVVLII